VRGTSDLRKTLARIAALAPSEGLFSDGKKTWFL
jgi:hypothetical protein